LVQYLGELAAEFPSPCQIEVYRNDKIYFATIEQMRPDGIVISPGAGRPVDAGISSWN
jgi:anthranilate synthase component 2